MEALAGDGPLAFVVGFSAIHGGILAEERRVGQTHLEDADPFNARGQGCEPRMNANRREWGGGGWGFSLVAWGEF